MSSKDLAVETLLRLWVYQEDCKRRASWKNLRSEVWGETEKTEDKPSEKESIHR